MHSKHMTKNISEAHMSSIQNATISPIKPTIGAVIDGIDLNALDEIGRSFK